MMKQRRHGTINRLYLILISISLLSPGARAQTWNRFTLLNGDSLEALRSQFTKGDIPAASFVKQCVANAEDCLLHPSYSVTQKKKTAGGRDLHDYQSQAPYWWPDSTRKKGAAYIRKDGQVNPEARQYTDRAKMAALVADCKALSLAYYFTKEERFAQKVQELLTTWFINPATKMNPHLNFAQFIPGKNEGSPTGIIESQVLVYLPDVLVLLRNSRYIDKQLTGDLQTWFNNYLNWLINSPLGRQEKEMRNNHGTYYDLQVAVYAAFTGATRLSARIINQSVVKRLSEQLAPDGSMPLETARTKSWDYTIENLQAFCKLASLSEKLPATNVWQYETRDKKSLKACFKWLLPYVQQRKNWPYQQITATDIKDELAGLLHYAAGQYPAIDISQISALTTTAKSITWPF